MVRQAGKRFAAIDTQTIVAVLAVVLGFVLGTGWDVIKTWRTDRTELARAIRTVDQEIDINHRVIANDTDFLRNDDVASDNNQEIVGPLDVFKTTAGEVAFLKGSFENKSVELSLQVRDAYTTLAVLNREIESREMYRATNAAMTNYNVRRKILNGYIERRLPLVDRALRALSAALKDAVH